MNPELKKNLSSGDHWVRALYVILFLLFAKVAGFLVALVAVVQIIFSLVAGQFNRQLLRFGDSLAQYLAAVFSFVVGKTEAKPFPFADWPVSDIPAEEPAIEPEAVVDTSAQVAAEASRSASNSEDVAAQDDTEQTSEQASPEQGPSDNSDDNSDNKPKS